jgi:hypothetical protein
LSYESVKRNRLIMTNWLAFQLPGQVFLFGLREGEVESLVRDAEKKIRQIVGSGLFGREKE